MERKQSFKVFKTLKDLRKGQKPFRNTRHKTFKKMTPQIEKELHQIYKSGEFRLGEFLYMGMALANGQRVCISVAYKIDYCIKKALQFENTDENVTFTHINKVRVGQLKECEKFIWEKELVLN